MIRENEFTMSFAREVSRGVKDLTSGHARAWFSYKDDYEHTKYGPIKEGRKKNVYDFDGSTKVVTALEEGHGFKVVANRGKDVTFYKAGDEFRIRTQTFYGE